MIKGQTFICFCEDFKHTASSKHFITKFLRENKVIWVNSVSFRSPRFTLFDLKRIFVKILNWIRQPQNKSIKNLFIYSPMVIPFYHIKFIRKINEVILLASIKRIMRKQNIVNPILWFSLPMPVDMVGKLSEKLSIYYCGDEFSEFPGVNKAGIIALEQELMKKADMVITSAQTLLASKKIYNKHTYFIPHGVEYERFDDKDKSITTQMEQIKRPIVGYYGRLDNRIDLKLLYFLAKQRPQYSFYIIGPVIDDFSCLLECGNVYLPGGKLYQELPAYLHEFDVALIPYVLDEITKHINPLKLMEYFAVGLPVVTTNLSSLDVWQDILSIAQNNEDFLNFLDVAVKGGTEELIKKQKQIAKDNSWQKKAELVSGIIEERISEK